MLNKRCMRTNANKWKCLLNSLFWLMQRDIEAPHYWPLVTEIHRWPVESPHKRHHSKNCDPDIFRNGCTGLIFCYGIGVVRNPMQGKAQYAKEVPYDVSLSSTTCRSFCLGLHRYDNVMTWTEMLSILLAPLPLIVACRVYRSFGTRDVAHDIRDVIHMPPVCTVTQRFVLYIPRILYAEHWQFYLSFVLTSRCLIRLLFEIYL